jgi:uncharacterized protein YwqG
LKRGEIVVEDNLEIIDDYIDETINDCFILEPLKTDWVGFEAESEEDAVKFFLLSLFHLRDEINEDPATTYRKQKRPVTWPSTALRDTISRSYLSKKKEVIQLVREAVHIRRDCSDKSRQNHFVSRFGGIPDLPVHVAWPRNRGIPLSCVAQINLSELPNFHDRNLLPNTGMLYFFYDSTKVFNGSELTEGTGFAVYYSELVEEGRSIFEIKPPDLHEQDIFLPARLSFEIVESFPDAPMEFSPLENIRLTDQQHGDYFELAGKLSFFEEHQLLGNPSSRERSVASICQELWLEEEGMEATEKAVIDGMQDWVLLLQVATDNELGMYWPDEDFEADSLLYFMIRKYDLLEKRFDRVWMVKP